LKKAHLYLLGLLSGLLLTFSWFPVGFAGMIFLAFVPLLIVEQQIAQSPQLYKRTTLFSISYITFFLWNVLVTWWIKNASFGGAAMAILCNALLMALVFVLVHRVKKRVGEKWGYLVFISFWIAFEFIHLDWDLTWPWLTLGNVFAETPHWIQWYEYTGVFGGSLWVLIVNVLIFKLITNRNAIENRKAQIKKGIIVSIIILVPILTSALVGLFANKYWEGGMSVVVVQPNIDPYNEKFFVNYQEQLQKMLVLASEQVDSTTQYLLLPETALTEDLWENQLQQSWSVQTLQKYIQQFPNLKIVIGASTAKVYQPGEPLSATARKFTNDDAYYDSYNTALQLDSTGKIQIYHKSKLVPGVEKMPFPFIFKYVEKFAIDLGGTSGSLGMQDTRTAFFSPDRSKVTAPVVCYESIYGEYVSEYINNGAQFISIITNDGWWGDTPGYKQHLKYGALRAIETRKWIARSANTGVSCFINPMGEILQATEYWKPAVIKQRITLSDDRTFYTKHGDIIARLAFGLSLVLIVYSLLIRFKILKK
jgi:apolipoprotein N-acyltransferase